MHWKIDLLYFILFTYYYFIRYKNQFKSKMNNISQLLYLFLN